MKKQLKKVLVLGSGALKIGQAGEFDYSGSQALKALREEGISSVLINPNVATIQTSEGIADKVYFLPVTPFFVTEIIKKERPDGIMLAWGGQTGLNVGTELYLSGVLKEYGVEVLGTSVEAIMNTEDRDLFVKELNKVDLKVPVSHACENMEEAVTAARNIGYPIMIRSAYALGGLGSGVCKTEEEFKEIAESAFTFAPQVLVEESLKGWKEIEFECIRDANDRCFTVASMENFDPLGIHTGESIVVAPTCSLTDEQVKMLQDIAVKCVRHLNIVGECNIQYAFNAETNDYRIIEINARLSRSSALASKATGYPLAFVAAKIALGYTLDQIGEMGTPNSAYVAPSLDYMICKIPRWDLTKFAGVSRKIGSSMKSVGEIMSIGRSFEEMLQKGLRMIGQGMHGFVGNDHTKFDNLDEELSNPTDLRIFAIAQALEEGYTIERIEELTKIDPWFIERMKNIVDYKHKLSEYNTLEEIPAEVLREAKVLGFSDFQIGRFVLKTKDTNMEKEVLAVRALRKKLNILPAVKRIPTVASEHPDLTNYLYMTYAVEGYDVNYYKNEKSVIVLGSGAYRIGSSVEFDWCSVNAINTARKLGYKSIMINYNPETVSTDYDMCDRLYFDELTFERVMDIIEMEQPHGVIVSTGGQIPNNLAQNFGGAVGEDRFPAGERGSRPAVADDPVAHAGGGRSAHFDRGVGGGGGAARPERSGAAAQPRAAGRRRLSDVATAAGRRGRRTDARLLRTVLLAHAAELQRQTPRTGVVGRGGGASLARTAAGVPAPRGASAARELHAPRRIGRHQLPVGRRSRFLREVRPLCRQRECGVPARRDRTGDASDHAERQSDDRLYALRAERQQTDSTKIGRRLWHVWYF